MTTYTIEIDLDRTGSYGAANGDVTQYVVSAAWQTGMADSYDEVSQPARLTLMLDNSSGVFFPEDAASPYYNKLVKAPLARIRATHDSATYTLYEGKIVKVQPTVGHESLCIITCEDPLLTLLDAEYEPELLQNVTVDGALAPIFEQPLVIYPYTSEYWLLDVAELDTGTKLFGAAAANFETASTTLAYVGDNLDRGAGVSAQGFIREMIAAEAGGRFFFDPPNRQFVFHNRQHDILNLTVDETFTEADFSQVDYVYGADVLNDLTINFQPRSIGAAASILWTYSNTPLQLRPGETRRLTARYSDPDSNEKARVGARDFVQPVAGADFIANRKEDGSGKNLTNRLGIYVVFEAARAVVTLSNPTSRDMYITTLQLRGTPIRSYEMQTVRAIDAQSIADYDRHPRAMTITALDDVEFAQQYADFLVGRFKDPVARFRSVTLSAGTGVLGGDGCGSITAVLSRRVGDRIGVTESQTQHDTEYIIVGERHVIQQGTHDATWILLPASRTQYWRLSDGANYTAESTLGTTTRLML